jgi:hypothetical protein
MVVCGQGKPEDWEQPKRPSELVASRLRGINSSSGEGGDTCGGGVATLSAPPQPLLGMSAGSAAEIHRKAQSLHPRAAGGAAVAAVPMLAAVAVAHHPIGQQPPPPPPHPPPLSPRKRAEHHQRQRRASMAAVVRPRHHADEGGGGGGGGGGGYCFRAKLISKAKQVDSEVCI